MLNKNTFGKSKACERLVEELNKLDAKTRRKVSSLLNNFDLTIKELYKINSKVAINFGILIYNEYKTSSERHPIQYKTFLGNVITYKYRIFLQNIEAQKRTENRKDYKGG